MEALYPYDGVSMCNSTAIRQAARHMARFYDSCLAEVGLRGAQYTMLLYLSRTSGVSVNQLAEVMVMDRTTIAHAMKPLERDGLVTIEVNPRDKRGRVIELTKDGKKRVKAGYAAWEKAQALFEDKFGTEKARAMRQTMADVVSMELLVG